MDNAAGVRPHAPCGVSSSDPSRMHWAAGWARLGLVVRRFTGRESIRFDCVTHCFGIFGYLQPRGSFSTVVHIETDSDRRCATHVAVSDMRRSRCVPAAWSHVRCRSYGIQDFQRHPRSARRCRTDKATCRSVPSSESVGLTRTF